MPRARKKSVRPEHARKGKKGPSKLEPLHPKPDILDKSLNDLVKLHEENPYPVMRIHKNGTMLYANKASEPLLKARGSSSGRPAPAEWLRIVKKVFSSGQVLREEMRHDGRIFAFRVAPISGTNYVNFYGFDITERKRLEETLITERQELNLIIDSLPIIVFHKDKEGKFVRVNRAFVEALGIPEEQFLGQTVFDLYSAQIAQTMTKDDREVFRTGMPKLNIVEQYESAKGIRWVRTDKIPIFDKDDDLTGLVGFAQDITEHKRAEKALRESEGRFRSLFEQAADAIVVFDSPTGAFLEFNDKACVLLGYTREEFGKLNISDTEAIESAEEILAHIKKVVRQGSDTFETKQRKKDGTLCDILVSTTPVTIGGKQYIQGIWRDITEQKIAQKRLLEYQKNLKRLAARLTLTEERERRRIARDLHDQVSQSLALAKIKIDTMLASEKASPLAETLKETNDTIEKAIQNTMSLTFDLSHPILYELGFEAAVAEWLQEQVQKKHGIITEFYDDGLPKPLDDDVRALLFRNVRELLINTIKHARADKVNVSVNKTGDSIKITIEDNGVGLNVEEITASRKGSFGLFSIRESISELGGNFEIVSKPGAGCKAVMTAPLKGTSRPKEE
jgi:PAS domain S-box-containing protein